MVQVYRGDLATSYTVDASNTDAEGNSMDLAWYKARGYNTDSSVQGTALGSNSAASPVDSGYNYEKGLSTAEALYSFFPENVTKEFAKAYVKFGDAATAASAVRNTGAWKQEFGWLEDPKDGTLIMTELEALGTIASFRETLGEVGITNTEDFEDDFQTLVTGRVSAGEFQDRIDLVYTGIKDQIPEVEKLFREQYGIESDESTIFAALINPKIEDKLLKGEIQTLQLQAEASSRGFSTTFARFSELRKRGLSTEMAQGIYSQADTFLNTAASIGKDLDIKTLEEAALGDISAQNIIKRTEAQLQSEGGMTLGAAKKDGKVTGLIE